jgi:ureidoglycolate hydrolase
MNALSVRGISARDLDPTAFASFGNVIRPRAGGGQFDKNPYDPETSGEEPELVLCNARPRLWIMHLFDRGLRFEKMARHRRVSQCLGSLGGKEWFMAFAPPQDLGDGAVPDISDVVAFRIPGDCVLKLHLGTWHAGPHFTHRECMFFNLENIDTNKRDFHQVELATPCAILA